MATKSFVGHLSKEIACKQGAVRAVRFNGKHISICKIIFKMFYFYVFPFLKFI